VHPQVGLYDGFLLHSRTATALALHPGADGAAPAGSAIRADTSAKVIALQDEWTVAVAAAWLNRQIDSTAFRLWEVAGTGHIDRDSIAGTTDAVLRDLGFAPPVCTAPLNEAPLRWVVGAALVGLDAWIDRAMPPPHAPSFIDVATGSVLRDAYGNATGGVRLPQLDVPMATHTSVGNAGPGPCPVAGVSLPFDAATLGALYPTHGAYVSQFAHATNALRRAGFLLPLDAEGARSHATREALP
jgi:Alpha/beta hydrolase domain